MKLSPVIVVDRREKHAWKFANLRSQPGTLSAGDYSISGLENSVSIERKSLDDLLSCIGIHRDRFKRELQRLKAYRFRALIIEASHAELEAGQWRSQLKPSHVLGSLAAWTAQSSLPIWQAGDHESAAWYAERYLFQAARYVTSENAAIGAAGQCVA